MHALECSSFFTVIVSDFFFLAQQGDGPNVFSYFGQSNLAGKAIVILLILASLIAWTVMVGKYLDLGRSRTLNRLFERKLAKVPSLLRFGLQGESIGVGPHAALTMEALQAYRNFIRRQHGENIEPKMAVAHVENALQRVVAQQSIRYESKMVLLASIVSGAPFLGLLGTVWGVMDAFGSMSLQSTATLQNLAPGVSGALLTTVAALLVAIPSVFGYNFLFSQVKLMIMELENFASSLADRVELEVEQLGED